MVGATPGLTAQRAGPQRVPLGDSTFDGHRIQPFLGRWRVLEVARDGGVAEGPRYQDEGRITVLNGKQVFVQVQHTIDSTDGLLVITDHRSFRPIVAESYDRRDGAFIRTEYQAGKVVVQCSGGLCPRDLRAAAGDTARKETLVAEPVFDFWAGSYGLLLAGLPLRSGYEAELPLYHPVRGLIWITVRVTGEDSVSVGAGSRVRAWIVRLPQTPFTFSISDQSPYWVRLVAERADGTRQIMERY